MSSPKTTEMTKQHMKLSSKVLLIAVCLFLFMVLGVLIVLDIVRLVSDFADSDAYGRIFVDLMLIGVLTWVTIDIARNQNL